MSYPGARVSFGPAEREREVDVRIHEVTDDVAGTALRELSVRLDWLGDRLEVSEELRVDNPGSRTVFVAEGKRAGHAPAAELGLPAAARELSGPLGLVPEGVEHTRDRLRWYGPVFPGGGELGYKYELPAPEGALRIERALPKAPIRVTVLAPAGGPALSAPRAQRGRADRDLRARLQGALAASSAGGSPSTSRCRRRAATPARSRSARCACSASSTPPPSRGARST